MNPPSHHPAPPPLPRRRPAVPHTALTWLSAVALILTPGLAHAATASPATDRPPEVQLPSAPDSLHLRLPTPPGTDPRQASTLDLAEDDSSTTRIQALRVPAIDPRGLAIPDSFEWMVSVPPRAQSSSIRRFHPGPASDKAPTNSAFRFSDVDPQSLGLWEGQQPVFVYRHGVIHRDGVPADRARSTYLHPVYGLDGEVLTDDFPEDHHHHRGLFWAWPHVGVGGKNHDLWALNGIEQRFERWLSREGSGAGAVLGVENGWYVGDRKVMTERIWFTVYPASQDRRAIDMDAYWIPTTEPVSLAGAEGKSYGGLTLRYAPRQNTVITTPLGNGTNDLYITRLPWADLSAHFQGAAQPSGAALFVAPDHPDFPPTWLTRHYGVLCLGWPGVQARTFEPGVPIRCRYRTWIHRGKVTQPQLESAYAQYTHSLAVAWTRPDPAPPQLHAVQTPDRVQVFVEDRLFTEYQYPAEAKLPHFHPLIGPRSNRSITVKEADPYPHHASLWFGCDRVNGGNYWQEGLDRGRIRSEQVRLVEDGHATGRVVLEQDCLWVRPGAEAPFRDHRTIRITAPSTTRRVIDFDIVLTALTDVRVEKSNHSLFAARMAPDLAVTGGGRLINSVGGTGESGTFGKPAVWMDARGTRSSGEIEGLTLFPYPTNPGHPVPWFTRDYGFLSPTPLFWLESGEHRIAQGESIRLQYRVVVHADNPTVEELGRLAPTAASAPAAVPPPQPITHEALWRMPQVGPPEPSPDGRWVVVSVKEPAYDEADEVSDLWLVAGDNTSAPRRLTTHKSRESAPSWSPDGTRIAFTAKRDGDDAAQVYVLELAGGEARRLTSVALGARDPRWSPDGRWLLFQAPVHRGATHDASNRQLAEQRKKAKSKVRAYDSFPIRRWDKWLDDTQTHLWILPVDRSEAPRDLLAGSRLVENRGYRGAGDEGSSDTLQPAWAPDSRSIVITATTDSDVSAFAQPTFGLFEVRLEGGEPRRLTGVGENASSAQFTPDGSRMVFRTNAQVGRRYYALERLAAAAWPWTEASRHLLTQDFDRSVDSFTIDPAGRWAYFTADDAGHAKIWKLPLAGGSVSLAVDAPQGMWASPRIPERAAAPVLFASREAAHQPAELFRVDLDSGRPTRLTEFTVARAAAIDWQPLRSFSFTNAVGRPIHSFLALPPGFDEGRKYPLLVLIHGGHQSMWRDALSKRWNYHLLAAPGYVVLLTDYVGSTGYGETFTLSILGDPLRGPADDVNAAADEAIRRFPYIDGTRQAAAGASYGGHLVNWLEATTTRYKCLIGHAGLASLYSQWGTSDAIHHRELMMDAPFWKEPRAWLDQSPASYADRFRTPMLLSIGENDFRVPLNNTLEMWSLLQRQKVPGRLLVWPDENHWILKGENSRVFYQEVQSWLARWLGPVSP